MSSIIKTHMHNNYDILKEFSESPDSVLLYKGKPIVVKSDHETKKINDENGIHGIRYYDKRLQCYFDDKWNDISTGGNTTIVTDKDIVISPVAYNALTKLTNGYYVPEFMISKQVNNALVKYSDGYYVPKIPVNMATTEDINNAKKDIDLEIKTQQQKFNEKYNVITNKINEIAGNSTKNKVHRYSGNNDSLDSVIDISSLYSITSNVILSLEFMICNLSNSEMLNVKILENNIETLNDTLTKSETQKYKLSNIPNIEIFIQGSYDLFLYVNYI